ncbi:hypothetical protein [uncultured Robinsoniella sp.]|uniref:hypothetical protein n=1 Tax=uncultured Robinsoniella sp. TaxID=904190 RepID=UPI00374E5434
MLSKNEFDEIPIPENIDDVIDKGVKKAVKLKKRQRRKKFITTTTGIAAAVAVFSLFCVSNPALAAKIPLIGHIFERVETTVSYKGDFSSTAEVLVTEGADDADLETEITNTENDNTENNKTENAKTQNANTEINKMDPADKNTGKTNAGITENDKDGNAKSKAEAVNAENDEKVNTGEESKYVKSSNGLTVTVSEVYYSTKALYLAMSIKNEEEFPQDFIRTKNMDDYILDYDVLSLNGTASFSFSDIDVGPELYIEGQFIDNHTFAGIYRVPLDQFSYYPTDEEIAATGLDINDYWTDDMSTDEAAKKVDEYNLKLKEKFPDIGKPIPIPDSFTYNLNITDISGELFETKARTVTFPEGDTGVVYDNLVKKYEGNWDFQFDVALDTSRTSIIELNDTNADGLGISKIEKTPYEISAQIIIPSDKLNYDYFLVMLDKNGELMDYQGSFTDTYQLYGRDTSTVYLYICDYIQYMDEIKGYYWSPDYEEKKKTKTYKQYLDEKSLYHTEVSFEE